MSSANHAETLTTISLKDILSPEEILSLQAFPAFEASAEHLYEKNELILSFITAIIDKYSISSDSSEKTLSKCFLWVKKQLQSNLEFVPDMQSIAKIEKLGQTSKEQKMKMGWLREFSSISRGYIHKESQTLLPSAQKCNSAGALDKNSANKKERKSFRESFIQSPSLKRFSANAGEVEKFCVSLSTESDNTEDELDFSSSKFNIFKFVEKIGRENILPVMSFYIFDDYDLFSEVKYERFEQFVLKISQGYRRENPYHTDLHAADLIQSLYVYLSCTDMYCLLNLSSKDLFSLFISAIIHDYAHPGFNNNFLISTNDDIAIKYNDISVLENYHVSEAFQLIKGNKDLDIFEGMSNDDYKNVRKSIIHCVLATDMSSHDKKLQKFKLNLKNFNIEKGKNFEKMFENSDPIAYHNLKQEFLSFTLHAADISNPTKPLEICKEWGQRCIEEFFKQGDKEKELGMPISFNCDRSTVILSQSQIGFINFIVEPMFTVLNEYFPELEFTLENLKTNREYYKSIKDEEEKK